MYLNGFRSPNVVACASNNRCMLFLVVIAFLLVHSTAFATKAGNWEPESLEFTSQTGNSKFDCASSCHTVNKVTNLKMTVPSSVAHDATSADVSLSGFTANGNLLAAWRYQIEGGSQGSLVDNVRPPANSSSTRKKIQFDATEDPINVRYCLVDANDNTRNWNCQKLTINRDPKPNEAPFFTSPKIFRRLQILLHMTLK